MQPLVIVIGTLCIIAKVSNASNNVNSSSDTVNQGNDHAKEPKSVTESADVSNSSTNLNNHSANQGNDHIKEPKTVSTANHNIATTTKKKIRTCHPNDSFKNMKELLKTKESRRQFVNESRNLIPQWKASDNMNIRDKKDEAENIKILWLGENCNIRYYRDKYDNIILHWQVDDTLIHIYQGAKGDVNQEWIFGNVDIKLNNFNDGSMDHKWNFGDTQYYYSRKSKDDNEYKIGWTGEPDHDSITIYRQFITNWCIQHSELYISKCIIEHL